mgnify:CR=1 FL=1
MFDDSQIVRTFLDQWAVDNFLAMNEIDEIYKGGLYSNTIGSKSYTSNVVDEFKEMGLIEEAGTEGKKKLYEFTDKGKKLRDMFLKYFPTIRDK